MEDSLNKDIYIEYMKRRIKANNIFVKEIEEDLKKNSEFILDVVSDENFKCYNELLEIIDKELINPEFILSYAEILSERKLLNQHTIKRIINILPDNFLGNFKGDKDDNDETIDNEKNKENYEMLYKYLDLGFTPSRLGTKLNPDMLDDAEYMQNVINKENDIVSVKLIGKELRKDSDFIMKVLKNEDFKWVNLLLKQIEGEVNEECILLYINILLERDILDSTKCELLSKKIPKDYFKNNPEDIDKFIKYGFSLFQLMPDEITYNEYIIRKRKDKIKELLSRIESVTPSEFKKITNYTRRNDQKFMFEVISKNPSLYVCTNKELKMNKEFTKQLIDNIPEIKEILEADSEYQQILQERKQRVENRIALKEQKKQENIEKQKELEKEYKEQGEKHPNLILVRKFLNLKTSKKLFCQKNNINIDELNKIMKEVASIYPEIDKQLEQHEKETTAIHFGTIEKINNDLIMGNMTLKQYSKERYLGKTIDVLLKNIEDSNMRKQFHSIVINSINSGELTMMDYMRLFSSEYDYKHIIEAIKKYLNIVVKEAPELQSKNKLITKAHIKVNELRKYSKPFNSKDFLNSRKGFTGSEGKVEMHTITQEHLDYAKKYLHLEDEYICYITVDNAISKILKQDVTFEEIDNRIKIKKENSNTISMQSAVKNAIRSGITLEQVHQSEVVEKHIKEKSENKKVIGE